MIEHLEIDVWVERRNEGYDLARPSRADTQEQFGLLNGSISDSLLAHVDEQRFLAVGGGWEGEFIVTVVEGPTSRHLLGNRLAGIPVMLPVGGQDVPVDPRYIVTAAAALQALLYYYDHEKHDPDLSWDVESFDHQT